MVHGASPEKPEEVSARRFLDGELNMALDRIAETAVPTVDYRSPDSSNAFEVKRVTSEDFNSLQAAFGAAGHIDSLLLRQRWTVMVSQPTLSASLAPMPNFPDDDEAMIANAATWGLTIQRKAEREAEWRAQRKPARRPPSSTPRLKNLGRKLEPHLAVLEANNITTTRGLGPFDPRPGVSAAAADIWRLTNGALCRGYAPVAGRRPGVDIALTSTGIRTGRPNTVVERIQLWLDSDLSENLRASLANEAPGTERHAVLVFDRTEPEIDAAREQITDFRPDLPLALPAEIDVLWFLLGPVACRYRPGRGWSTHRAQP